ncbi:helix-turn-helix transcriptional regulator [Apibacter adventoris]|uniref:Transcriptional regulator n=1 Tax=Apibacter adventoris TaxID=1679466 RepID=A0A2S8A966_9FLAO|nr:helix-turn-helix transcriptional regulator [Apibacter adventoris]PQL91060.1 transcriptional regulator [Apibacter adventoris]PQL95087.1 transcriptional regulator [Apibacter adventoris]
MISKKLIQLRRKKRISQKEVAESIGVSQSTLCDWESGKRNPKVESLFKLAEYFKVDIKELYNLKKE